MIFDLKFPHEEWRPVVGYPYDVSSYGRVRNVRGHILSPSRHVDGYQNVRISKSGRAKTMTVHRLISCAFLGKRPEGLVVNHIDHNPANNLIWNLEYISSRDNISLGFKKRSRENEKKTAREFAKTLSVGYQTRIAEEAVAYMAKAARKLNRKMTPLILVGDLGDQNSIERKNGFYNAINANPDLFKKPIEVPTKWDAATTLANLEAALQVTPEVDFIFTSSDFLYPQIKAVLEPLGKWKPIGDADHVILGGLDGDSTAYRLMQEGYVDATGVQDLFFEADAIMDALLEAIEKGRTRPEKWIQDPGFALTQENMAERQMDMWGCRILKEAEAGTAQ